MSETPQADKTALLLDDNLMSAVRVRKQLERAGYSVRASGALPLQNETKAGETRITPPDLVLINLGSRSLHGTELVTATKTQFPAAQVLGYCGHTEIEIRKAAKAAGIGRIFTNEQAMIELAQLLV